MNSIFDPKVIMDPTKDIKSSVLFLAFLSITFSISIIFNIDILLFAVLSLGFPWSVLFIMKLGGRHILKKEKRKFEEKYTTRSEAKPVYEFTKNNTKYRVKRYRKMLINSLIGYNAKKYLGLEEKDNNEWVLASEEEYNGQNPKEWGDNEIMYH